MKEDGEEKTSPALTVPEQTESEPVWLETITECPRVSLTESLTSITYLSIKI